MRRVLLFTCLLIASRILYGQVMTANDFVKALSFPQQKFAGYLSKEGFFRSGQYMRGDTAVQEFQLKAKIIARTRDSASRYAEGLFLDDKTAFSYYTTSENEYNAILKSLKEGGFHCEGEDYQSSFLYQRKDITVKLSRKFEDTLSYYNFFVKKDVLPSPKSILYAEDFLAFQSHENLEYVFGKSNVQKDIYYFSDSEVVRCSVLFPKTNRQIIFIWKDELNRRTLSHLLVGNSLRNLQSVKDNEAVMENIWTLRNGLRANMSLPELVKMNNGDFSFFGLDSPYPGTVVPAKNGNIDFKNTGVILSCLNCTDSELMRHETISANEAIENSKRLFVLALVVVPQKETYWTAFHK